MDDNSRSDPCTPDSPAPGANPPVPCDTQPRGGRARIGLVVDGWTVSGYTDDAVMHCLIVQVVDDVSGDLAQIPLPGIIQLLAPASVYHDLAQDLQTDTTGALGSLTTYQRALLVDFIKIFESFAENSVHAPDFAPFIRRLVRASICDHAATVWETDESTDHSGRLHGFSQWARAWYPEWFVGSAHSLEALDHDSDDCEDMPELV